MTALPPDPNQRVMVPMLALTPDVLALFEGTLTMGKFEQIVTAVISALRQSAVSKWPTNVSVKADRSIFVLLDRCIEDLGTHYEGCLEGPADFDFAPLEAEYWELIRKWRNPINPDGSRNGIVNQDTGILTSAPHPGEFSQFVIARNPEFKVPENVRLVGE
jgi:hypothetical protein